MEVGRDGGRAIVRAVVDLPLCEVWAGPDVGSRQPRGFVAYDSCDVCKLGSGVSRAGGR